MSDLRAFSSPGLPPGDWPGIVSPSQYSPPDNLTDPGNYSLLRMASGTVGATPEIWILYVQRSHTNHYTLAFQTGIYNASQAYAVLTGACASYSCSHHDYSWGPIDILANLTTAITGTAMVSSGPEIAVAYASSGTTYIDASLDGGSTWTSYGSFTGSSPQASASPQGFVLTGLTSSGVTVLSESWACSTSTSFSVSGVAENATPLYYQNGTLSVFESTSSNHQITDEVVNAARTGIQSAHNVGTWAPNSTSSVVERIGTTDLATPGGVPGQIAVVANGSDTIIAYTSSVGGRAVLNTAISVTGGNSWQGPYLTGPAMGAVQDPQIQISPSGQLGWELWRSDNNGTWDIQVEEISLDGRTIAGPSTVPGSGGSPFSSAASTSLVFDAWDRPMFAWLAAGPGGNQILFSGADASAASLVSDWVATSEDLHVLDFKSGSSSSRSAFIAQVKTVDSDVMGGQYSNAANYLESTIYPELTKAPLTLACDAAVPLAGCTTLAPSGSSIILAPVGGPATPSAYLVGDLILTLESLGIGVLLPANSWAPAGASGCFHPQILNLAYTGSGILPPSGGAGVSPFVNLSALGGGLQAVAHPYNPKSANLSVALSIPARSVPSKLYHNNLPDCSVSDTCAFAICNTTFEYSYSITIGLSSTYMGSLTTKSFLVSTNLTTFYLTNLTYSTVTYFAINATAHEKIIETGNPGGSCSAANLPSGKLVGYTNLSLGTYGNPATWGSVWTSLNISAPAARQVSSSSISAGWSSNQPVASWLNFTTGASPLPPPQSTSGFVLSPSYSVSSLGSGYYNFTEASRTQRATVPSPSSPGVSLGNSGNSGKSLGQLFTKEVCGLGPNPISISGASVVNANVSTSNVTVVWYTNYRTNGSLNVTLSGSDTVVQYNGVVSTGSSGSYKSVVELHELLPWAFYTVAISASFTRCNIYYVQAASTSFSTPRLFESWESDDNYDSVTNTGGGALVSWLVPGWFATTASFVNGTLDYWPSSNRAELLSVPIETNPALPGLDTSGLTIYELVPNTSYSMTIQLSYALNSNHTVYPVSSWEYNFTYLRDTSGDGLSDAEKVSGWSVTYQNATGAYFTGAVNANPGLFATNYLVSDYVEKEYGLNPRTLDTAGSGMLDTWNLTFDLGTNASNPTYPSEIRSWSELGYYNFSNYCAYPTESKSACFGQLTHTGASEPSNLSDNSPWASEVLWSKSALGLLQVLIDDEDQGQLEGVLGTTTITVGGTKTLERTLTVEGKLSWGADPLASSTTQDGTPDGYQVDPLGQTYIRLVILNWTASPVSSGDEAAIYEHAWSPQGVFNPPQVDYSGYTTQEGDSGGSASYSGHFTATFPVTATRQFANLNLSLVLNHSGTDQRPASTANLSIDLMNTSVKAGYVVNGSNRIGYTVQVFTSPPKAPTYILLPADNSTLSPLPLGLAQYTSEQDFVLLTLNDTIGSISVGNIPYAERNGQASAATYTVAVSSGLDSVLVPRSRFITTPLGQILLNSTNLSIRHTSSNGFLETHWDPETLFARVNGSSLWNGTSYRPGSQGYIKAFSNSSQSCAADTWLCGDPPGEPNIEGTNVSRALEADIVLNVSSIGSMEAVLAGLLLNTSGNFTSWLLNGTSTLSSLGLNSPIYAALANESFQNDGEFGAPLSHQAQSAPPVWSALSPGAIWNSLTGLVAPGIHDANAIWSQAAAGLAYGTLLNSIGHRWFLSDLSQTPVVLRGYGTSIWSGGNALDHTLINVVQSALEPIAAALASALRSAAQQEILAIDGLLSAEMNESQFASGAHNASLQAAQWNLTLAVMLVPSSDYQIYNIVFQEVGTLLQPLTSVVNVNSVFMQAWGASQNFAGPAEPGEILTWAAAMMLNGSIAPVAQSALDDLGFGGVSNASQVPTALLSLVEHNSSSTSFFSSFATYPQLIAEAFLTAFQDFTSPPLTLADFVLTFLAAVAWGLQALIPGVGSLDLVAGLGIFLTAVGFGTFLYGSWLSYLISVVVDILSVVLDWTSFSPVAAAGLASGASAAAKKAFYIEAVVDGIDMVADFYDVIVATPHLV